MNTMHHATHIISWHPTQRLGMRGPGKKAPGVWILKTLPGPNWPEDSPLPEWSLHAPRNADQAEITAWAEKTLGRTVALDREIHKVMLVRLSDGKGHLCRLPVYFARLHTS